MRLTEFNELVTGWFGAAYGSSVLADHVLTTSDKITAHFQKTFQIPDDRITTLPTGIDLELFSPGGESAALPGKDSGQPLIGMVSVLRSWKGHGTFLEAAAKLTSGR